MAESDERQRGSDRSDSRQGPRVLSGQAIGWTVVLLILAGYFAWMIIEMGGHAVTKAWPMLAVFAAAVAGGVAATLGLLLGRRKDN